MKAAVVPFRVIRGGGQGQLTPALRALFTESVNRDPNGVSLCIRLLAGIDVDPEPYFTPQQLELYRQQQEHPVDKHLRAIKRRHGAKGAGNVGKPVITIERHDEREPA